MPTTRGESVFKSVHEKTSKPILVTGATGKIGREVVRQLTAEGRAVRALVRSPEKGSTLERLGVQVAYGDFSRPESVAEALRGVEGLFLLSPVHESLATREAEIIAMAKRAGIRHVALLSGRGASLESPSALIRMHAQSEQTLRESGLGYTILRPDYFMQNLLGYASSIRARGGFESTFIEAPLCMIDCRDIASVAVAALTEEGHDGQSYELTGPEALSPLQAAERLTLGLGKPISCAEITPERLAAGLAAMGVPRWLVNDLTATPKPGAPLEPTTVVADILHRPPLSLDRFIQDNAALF